MKHLYTFISLAVFAFLFWASATKQVQIFTTTVKQYEDIERKTEKDTALSYVIPDITPTADTKLMIQKGDVTISCEIMPFNTENAYTESMINWWADPAQPDYDVIQVRKAPKIKVTPNNVQFKLRIKNNSTHVLKLFECAIVLMIDGMAYSLSKEDMTEWTSAMVVKQFEKEYFLNGPDLASLKNPKVMYILVNDVPTQFDDAATTTKRENFEWYFNCSAAPITKNEKISYQYREVPVRKEHCNRCNGLGRLSEVQTCSVCKGTGSYKNIYDGKYYTCSRCSGTGRETIVYKCPRCNGAGQLSYPVSKMPEVTSSTKFTGWDVTVESKPIGAKIKVVNTKTGEYENAGTTNESVTWWYNSSSATDPIIVEYDGKEVKVLPYKNGKAIAKVFVDFTSGEPVVKKGTRAD